MGCVLPQRHFVAAIAAVLLAGGPPATADPGSENGLAARIRTVHPEPIDGWIVELSLNSELVVYGGGERRRLPIQDVVAVEAVGDPSRADLNRAAAEPPVGADRTLVMMANGDWIVGRIVRDGVEAIIAETEDLGTLTIPLEQVALVRFPQAAGAGQGGALAWFDREGPGEDDRVLLTNGDIARGFITAIGRETLTLENGSRKDSIPLRLAVAARLIHARPAPPEGVAATADFRDGSRITFGSLEWKDRRVEAQPAWGARLEFDAGRLTRMGISGGRWEWLSSQAPISYEHTPMLALDWEYRADRNVLGGPLRVGGERFERGIGVHSRSSLVFELKGAYRELVTRFGIDDDSGPAADVDIRILVDGQRRYERNHIQAGTVHEPIRIDVTKAGRVELVVDFGDNGDIQDRFNWIDTGLVRP